GRQPPGDHASLKVLILCLCQRGQIEFEVVYVAPEVDSDDENVEYEDDSGHRYRLYLDELDDSSTAPPSNSSASLQALEKMSLNNGPENGDTGISSETPSEETPSKPPETDCSF
ncbi:Golgi-associated PDZ and coiled-coil motif-containing protein-like, partial [Seriola lalandi dorsalis]|uniref:Golgi-associated PDZ and coiled-coil motif-containing protein-like n=1 Tax=Seriola lalandi dorsalis TaxID=1841481 RepID=UPI000C6F9E8C